VKLRPGGGRRAEEGGGAKRDRTTGGTGGVRGKKGFRQGRSGFSALGYGVITVLTGKKGPVSNHGNSWTKNPTKEAGGVVGVPGVAVPVSTEEKHPYPGQRKGVGTQNQKKCNMGDKPLHAQAPYGPRAHREKKHKQNTGE